MALTTLPNYCLFPAIAVTGATVINAPTLDAVDESAGWILRAGENIILRKVGFISFAYTSSAAVDVRVETVSAADGLGTGTLWATNTNGSATVNATQTYFEVTLTADATINAGDYFAIVIKNPSSGTPNWRLNIGYGQGAQVPYAQQALPTNSKISGSSYPCLYLESSTGTVPTYLQCIPAYQTTVSYSSSSTPDERALYFSVPVQMKIKAINVACRLLGDTTFILYDSDGSTQLATLVTDKDQQRSASDGWVTWYLSSEITLAANTFYRIAVRPDTTTAITLNYWQFPSSAKKDASPFNGWQLSTRTDAGSWSQDATIIPVISFLASQIHDGSGGGGVGIIGG